MKDTNCDSKVLIGFTLIELLTVITVIAVLAAMLLPAIKSVRISAIMSNCASNIRQIGQGIHSYAGENEGLLPWTLVGTAGNHSDVTWEEVSVIPYVAPHINWSLTGTNGAGPSEKPLVPVMVCPGHVPSDKKFTSTVYTNSRMSYVPNGTSGLFPTQGDSGTNRSISKAKSNQIMLIEVWRWAHCLGRYSDAWSVSASSQYFPRHRSQSSITGTEGELTNVLFFDGHTQSMPFAETAGYVNNSENIW